MGAPLHQRSSGPSLSEQQIMFILYGQQLSQPTRTPPQRPPAAQGLRNHDSPLSMAASLSHKYRSRVTLSPPPAQSNVSYNRAVQAIELTRNLRDDRRRERQSAS